MKKKLAALALCLVLVASPAGIAAGMNAGPVAGLPAGAPEGEPQTVIKDETVYLALDPSGKLIGADVVNHIETPAVGAYTDYGAYTAITNLTNDANPSVDGNAITWQLQADPKGFYYQGALAEAQPPMLFAVAYTLDGKEMAPADMAGKAGKVTIRVEAWPNGAANPAFTKNYFCQIQASLNLDRCQAIEAPGATMILTGRSQSLAYTALPGKSVSFTIGFDAADFAFGGFTMTAMPFDQKAMIGVDISGFRDDIDKMADGAQELVDGTEDLRDGLQELADGVEKLADGAADAKSGLSKYRGGVKDYATSVGVLASKAREISAGLDELAANGQALKAGYAQLSAGVDGVLAAMEPMAPPALAGQIPVLRAQLAGYGQGLGSYMDGVSQIAAGMKAFSDGLGQLKGASPELLSGLGQIIDGMASLSGGLATTAEEVAKLPGEVQKLVDGQTEFKDGIGEAGETFDQWDFGADPNAVPVSFASARSQPRSVQFIYKTADISLPDDAEPAQPVQTEKSFFEKLSDLFR